MTDQAIGLITLSEALNAIKETPDTDDLSQRNVNLRALIVQDSLAVAKMCGRRFDPYMATVSHNARSYGRGGRVDGRELILSDDHDLRSVSAVINGDGLTVDLSDVLLIPDYPPIRRLRLPQDAGSLSWWSGATDPINAIKVTGLWGYGGYFRTLGAPLTDDCDDTAESISVGTVKVTRFEIGQLLQVDSEYMLVTARDLDAGTVEVERGANGTTAAAHSSGAIVKRFYADEVIAGAIKRLWQWRIEQVKSPLFGVATMGDQSYPIKVDVLPRDVIDVLGNGNYIKAAPFGGV